LYIDNIIYIQYTTIMSVLLLTKAKFMNSLNSSDKLALQLLVNDYEENCDLDYEFINKLIALMGAKILNYYHLGKMLKCFVGRELTSSEEKYINLFLDKVDMKLGFPNGDYLIEQYDETIFCGSANDTRKIDEYKIGNYHIITVVEYNPTDTIMDIKNKIRNQNAAYRNYNLNLLVNGNEIYEDNKYIKRDNLIQLKLNKFDTEHRIDKLKDMRSKYNLLKIQCNNYKYPNHYSEQNYDHKNKLFKRSRSDAKLDNKKKDVLIKFKRIEKELSEFSQKCDSMQ
jgi:hypothetical protein